MRETDVFSGEFGQRGGRFRKKYEECVICHEVTDVECMAPVEARKCYIEGVGQLCQACYRQLYKET